MTMFRHSDCRLDHGARFKSWFIRGGKGGGGKEGGIRLIGASGTRWILMLMRERSREDNTSTRELPGHLYTPCVPYSVFRQVNLIQSRGPPGDFRCGEIVFATRSFLLSFLIEKGGSSRATVTTRGKRLVTGPELLFAKENMRSDRIGHSGYRRVS